MRPHCLGGLLHWNVGVVRATSYLRRIFSPSTWAKYQVTEEQYELDKYPPYCGGPCCLVSTQYAHITHKQAESTNPGSFTMEDVFFTGILRVKSRLQTPRKVNGICTHYNNDDKESRIAQHVGHIIHA